MSVLNLVIDGLTVDLTQMEETAVEALRQAGSYRELALLSIARMNEQEQELTRLRRRLREFAMTDEERQLEDERQRALEGRD